MKLVLGLGLILAVAWVVVALLLGVSPRNAGSGAALSLLVGMVLGGAINIGIRFVRAR